MSNEYWIWEVTFRTSDSSGESMVVAPDMDAAKESVASAVEGIDAFENVEQTDAIPASIAEQRFDGYMPRLRAARDTVDAITRPVRRRE